LAEKCEKYYFYADYHGGPNHPAPRNLGKFLEIDKKTVYKSEKV
jgi:hypothetical protein